MDGCLGPGADRVHPTFLICLIDEKLVRSLGELVCCVPTRALPDGGRVIGAIGFSGLHPFRRAHRPHGRWPRGAALPTEGLAPGAWPESGLTCAAAPTLALVKSLVKRLSESLPNVMLTC